MRLFSLVLMTLALVIVFSQLTGCTRRFFRARADQEVEQVLSEKDRDPAWKIRNFFMYPHPLARFADPSNPDRPPMPPDDPGAWSLAPRPQKPREVALVGGTGYVDLLESWDAENRVRLRKLPLADPANVTPDQRPPDQGVQEAAAISVASPPGGHADILGLDARGPAARRTPFLITLEQAVELGSFNSREYQNAREGVYLTALPVTLARFAFAAQFETLNQTIRQWAATDSSVGRRNRWLSGTTVGFSKFFSTGALLLVKLTNETVINLTSSQHTQSQSTLALQLVQPFLRGGGRAVALEPLTQTERNLLYAVRSFARFHKVFFVGIAAGDGGRDDGAVQGAGYYPTLLLLSRLRNEQQNERAFARTLRYFQALAGGGSISKLQVDQVEQAYLSAQSNVLLRQEDLDRSLDEFKLQLGVPTDLPLELDDSVLNPLTEHMRRYEDVEEVFTVTLAQAHELRTKKTAKELRASLRQLLETTSLLRGTELQKEAFTRWDAWQRLPKELEKRLEEMHRQRDEVQKQITDLDAIQKLVPPELRDRLRLLNLDLEIGKFEIALRASEQQPQRPELFQRAVDHLGVILAQARTERAALLRGEWPELPSLCLNGVNLLDVVKKDQPAAQNHAGTTALSNRLDLMNQRALLVDAWRKIAVVANSLQGTVDVGYDLEMLTPPGEVKPLAFAGKRSQHLLKFNFEFPWVRKFERNAYRATLIAYQRQRRELMLFEDQIVQDIRQHLRHLRQLAFNYEIQRRNLELAYFQVGLALETFRAPPAPGEQRDAATAAAALTQQLLNAQRSVPQAQNAVFAIWVDYVTTRMALYRDLELMAVDARGVWIDEFASGDCADQPALSPIELQDSTGEAPLMAPPPSVTVDEPENPEASGDLPTGPLLPVDADGSR
jgi:hypothetical protein